MRFPRLQHDEVRKALGLEPKAKLPSSEGIDPINIEGWVIWVTPRNVKCFGPHKRHRTLALCPKCRKIVSAGRIPQHAKVHPED